MNIQIGEWVLGSQRSDYNENTQFALYKLLPDGTRQVVEFNGAEAHLTTVPAGTAITRPSFSLYRDQMQAFIDTLWGLGLRPKDRRFEKEIDLQAAHLQDMRRIAFAAMDMDEPDAKG